MSLDLSQEISERFAVELREVRKPRGTEVWAKQLIPRMTPGSWYDSRDLASAVVARHGQQHGTRTGVRCSACRTWKWLPVSEGEVPVRFDALTEAKTDVVVSPDVFGDGLGSFGHLLFRRPLGEFLAEAHPSVWSVVEVNGLAG